MVVGDSDGQTVRSENQIELRGQIEDLGMNEGGG